MITNRKLALSLLAVLTVSTASKLLGYKLNAANLTKGKIFVHVNRTMPGCGSVDVELVPGQDATKAASFMCSGACFGEVKVYEYDSVVDQKALEAMKQTTLAEKTTKVQAGEITLTEVETKDGIQLTPEEIKALEDQAPKIETRRASPSFTGNFKNLENLIDAGAKSKDSSSYKGTSVTSWAYSPEVAALELAFVGGSKLASVIGDAMSGCHSWNLAVKKTDGKITVIVKRME